MYVSGFNPRAMSDSFAKLEKEGGVARGPSFSATIPILGIARKWWMLNLGAFPGKTAYRTDSAEFLNVKEGLAL